MDEIIQVQQADMLSAINRAEVDIQIATAKKYRRNITEVLNQIVTYATMDVETAEDCFYALRRQDGNGGSSLIEGISVRLAEIFAGAWGNLRIQTRIIGNDGKTITAQGVCLDLETNVAYCGETKRKITNKQGRTYSEDMQVVTGNAAAAIAFRNAVLKVIPKAVTKKAVDEIKKVALGQALDLETRRQNMIAYYAKLGVSVQQILVYCGVKSVDQIDNQMTFELRGLANSIKEGTTTVAEVFAPKPAESTDLAKKARQKAEEAKKKALNEPKANPLETLQAKAVDAETGEVISVSEE